MANPTENWKHRRKPGSPYEPERNIAALEREPVWDKVRECWKSVFSQILADRREKVPNMTGHHFNWDGTTYTSTGQSVICDTMLLRELNYSRRNQPGLRAFIWVYLEEEEDDYLFLVKGLK